jgi:hypothetical protein
MDSIIQVALPFILIAFVLYRRVKKSIGFQRFSPKGMRVRSVIFGVLGLILLAVGFIHPILFLADAVGIAAGGVLGYYAIRHFVYEWRAEFLYTRTHIFIESTVLILFLGRVLYRVLAVVMLTKQSGAATDANQMTQYTRDPATAAIFFIIIAYYLIYYSYLIRKGKSLLVEKQLVEV